MLHGGPGAGHDYLAPLEALAADRHIVFYDQLGCGKSDRPDDPSLWRIDRFVAEVGAARRGLGLDKVHVLGHSWGGWLAIEYMLTSPRGVLSLVLAGTSARVADYVRTVAPLVAALPAETREILRRHETVGAYHHPEYEEAGHRPRVETVCVRHVVEPVDALALAARDEAEPAHGLLVTAQKKGAALPVSVPARYSWRVPEREGVVGITLSGSLGRALYAVGGHQSVLAIRETGPGKLPRLVSQPRRPDVHD